RKPLNGEGTDRAFGGDPAGLSGERARCAHPELPGVVRGGADFHAGGSDAGLRGLSAPDRLFSGPAAGLLGVAAVDLVAGADRFRAAVLPTPGPGAAGVAVLFHLLDDLRDERVQLALLRRVEPDPAGRGHTVALEFH